MPAQPRARSGCCAKSCLALFIIAIVLVIAGGFGGYWVVNKAITSLTSDKPVAIKVDQPTDRQFEDAANKFNDVSNALTLGEEKTIVFTAGDINALIARHPGYFFPQLRGKIRFDFADNLLGADLSAPLTGIMPATAPKWSREWIDGQLKDRWFNGRVRAFFELVAGEATLNPKTAAVNGEVWREADFDRFTERSDWQKFINDTLLKDVMLGGKNPKDVFSGVASARIDGDKLVIITKKRVR